MEPHTAETGRFEPVFLNNTQRSPQQPFCTPVKTSASSSALAMSDFLLSLYQIPLGILTSCLVGRNQSPFMCLFMYLLLELRTQSGWHFENAGHGLENKKCHASSHPTEMRSPTERKHSFQWFLYSCVLFVVLLSVYSVGQTLEKTTHTKDSFYVMLSEGSAYRYLAPLPWAEHRVGRSMWYHMADRNGRQREGADSKACLLFNLLPPVRSHTLKFPECLPRRPPPKSTTSWDRVFNSWIHERLSFPHSNIFALGPQSPTATSKVLDAFSLFPRVQIYVSKNLLFLYFLAVSHIHNARWLYLLPLPSINFYLPFINYHWRKWHTPTTTLDPPLPQQPLIVNSFPGGLESQGEFLCSSLNAQSCEA